MFSSGLVVATPAFCGFPDDVFASHDDGTSSQALQDIVSSINSDDADDTTAGRVNAQVKAFYDARGYRLAWSGSEEAAERAAAVKGALTHADRQGLRSKDYTSALARWSDAPQSQDAADFDVAMTGALIRYALDVRLGRTSPHQIYKDVRFPSKQFDVATALDTAVRDGSISEFLAELPPPHPGYHWLSEALAHYLAINEKGGWPNMSAKSGKALAQRLAYEDPTLAQTPDPSGSDIQEALVRFQHRNGLEASGKLDSETVSALNVPASRRAQVIVANMERWRWVPRSFENRYILVNVPDQSLDFIEDQSSKLHSKVVIGKKTSPTPLMRTTVDGVVANPPWDIPDDIAAKKFIPLLRHNRHALSSHNMALTSSGQLEQRPGPGNVLGRLMLDSENDFGVYMHDTADKKLFLLSDREKSNGCIRVEKINPLASLVMGHDPDDGEDEDIKQAIDSGKTQELELSEPVAVYVLYWTAMAGSDGTVQFRPDLYGRDATLIAQLGDTVRAPRKKSGRVTAAVP
ncbi:MAG TPA: L,D-transpeptidase family protein [Rhizomicrobium sp.]|nr:L,D-transpeptidase family protein [Rhizomicrobium sp.]